MNSKFSKPFCSRSCIDLGAQPRLMYNLRCAAAVHFNLRCNFQSPLCRRFRHGTGRLGTNSFSIFIFDIYYNNRGKVNIVSSGIFPRSSTIGYSGDLGRLKCIPAYCFRSLQGIHLTKLSSAWTGKR